MLWLLAASSALLRLAPPATAPASRAGAPVMLGRIGVSSTVGPARSFGDRLAVADVYDRAYQAQWRSPYSSHRQEVARTAGNYPTYYDPYLSRGMYGYSSYDRRYQGGRAYGNYYGGSYGGYGGSYGGYGGSYGGSYPYRTGGFRNAYGSYYTPSYSRGRAYSNYYDPYSAEDRRWGRRPYY